MANRSSTADDAFVRGVLENPTDDACLVFSDWLEERGDALSVARAELVRVQVQLARWVPDRAERAALRQRERGLIAAHAAEWLGPLHGLCEAFHFERGLAHLTLKARRFVGRAFAEASEWLRRAGVRCVSLKRVGKHLTTLEQTFHLGEVVALDLAGNDLDDDALLSLLASPHLDRLAWLDLRNNGLTASGMCALLGSPLGGRLAGLELNAPDLAPETVRDLVAWRSGRDLAERRGGLPARLVNGLGMEFRLVPAGSFLMGSPESESERDPNEGPQHEVEITRPFYLGAYPVTQREYHAAMGHNPSHFTPKRGGGPLHPVETVSWDDCRAFCERLSVREPGRTYGLPTEAEWEYACRAGTETPFHFGEELNGTQANCDGRYPYGTQEKGPYLRRTCRVGSCCANAWGLFDMHGNVDEWCADYYDLKFYSKSLFKDPFNSQKEEGRVQRGGSCFDNARHCRAACRFRFDPSIRHRYCGFRVALRLD
jgi:uncharacterized protein (TIGR02996 family)